MLPLIFALVCVGSSLTIEQQDFSPPPGWPLTDLLREAADVQDIECHVTVKSVTIGCNFKREAEQQSINFLGIDFPILSPILRETQEFDIFGVPVSGSIQVTIGRRQFNCTITLGSHYYPLCNII
ncbi:uncharacterized protein LOC131939583 [Physella acuta]|uniref:uncharacterized protein LOC131939583 n=1 Tax=Physella acuta TaxID=109671 RepID=UPI0027DD4DBC|nr:uncharacterized protein LOC131939583 [Physella acuta]